MKERFAGETGHRILLETLKDQKLVAGNTELAEQIAAAGELLDVNTGESIITQGNEDNDTYLILAGHRLAEPQHPGLHQRKRDQENGPHGREHQE
jgi:hypothetical protein